MHSVRFLPARTLRISNPIPQDRPQTRVSRLVGSITSPTQLLLLRILMVTLEVLRFIQTVDRNSCTCTNRLLQLGQEIQRHSCHLSLIYQRVTMK